MKDRELVALGHAREYVVLYSYTFRMDIGVIAARMSSKRGAAKQEHGVADSLARSKCHAVTPVERSALLNQ